MKDLIKPLESWGGYSKENQKYPWCRVHEVRQLEQDLREAIEALIKMGKEDTSYETRHQMCRDLSEKLTGQEWADLKEIEL